MNPTSETTVRELAATRPEALRVLDAFGIDYCCGGGRTLAEACRVADRSFDELVAALEAEAQAAAARGSAERDWSRATCAELIDHIVATHHRYTREELERLAPLMSRVHRVHGNKHRHLGTLADQFEALVREMGPHLLREERVLFPYVVALEKAVDAGEPPPPAPAGHLSRPLAVMENDHETVGELLREMRATTDGYTPPAGACGSFRALYEGLAALERDVHRHVHLESNLLFPRAQALAGIGSW